MTISNITGQNFCPIADVDMRGAAAVISPANLNAETLPSYIPEWRGMNCFQRLHVAYTNINSCPEAKQLFDKVQAMGRIFWNCVPTHLARYGVRFNFASRVIVFSEDKIRPNPGVSLFLFELNNAEKASVLLGLWDQADKGIIDKYKFVYEVESFEYESREKHDQIAAACQISSEWPSDIPKFKRMIRFSEQEIELWMKTTKLAPHIKPSDTLDKINHLMVQEMSGHSESIEDTFDQIQANAALYRHSSGMD